MSTKSVLVLDSESLCAKDLLTLSKRATSIALSDDAWTRVARSRDVVDAILEDPTRVACGINTGFGLFSTVVIEPDQLKGLQVDLIRSHASGTGDPLTTPAQTRMLLALRINALAKGQSGIRVPTLHQLVDAAFNASCLSLVPSTGTMGASGDFSPLAHLALGLLDEGLRWDTTDNDVGVRGAAEVLATHGLHPSQLEAKEGLTLINGTQLITSIEVDALVRTQNVTNCTDVVVALSFEVLCGTANAFYRRIYAARPHTGQTRVVFTGPAADVATDIGYPGPVAPVALKEVPRNKCDGELRSREPEITATSRTPTGRFSGSAHPSSVDSISTSGAEEDHVSMGGFAAREALAVAEHVETVVAIELLAACQALDLLRPLRTTRVLEAVHAVARTRIAKLDKDRVMKPDVDAVVDRVRSGAIGQVAAPFLGE